MSRIHFFTTISDILQIANEMDRKLNLKAILGFDELVTSDGSQPLTVYENLSSIKDLGVATHGQKDRSVDYVVLDRSIELKPGIRETSSGNKRRYMRATLDERSASFQPGGEFKDAIVMGEILYELSSKESQKIVRAFRSAFKKHCPAKAACGFWIGPEAYQRLQSGCRLTPYYEHPQPELFDVSLDEVELLPP